MQGDGNINYHFYPTFFAPKCGKLKREHVIGKYFIIIFLLNLTDYGVIFIVPYKATILYRITG